MSCFFQNRERRPHFVTYVLKKWTASKAIWKVIIKISSAMFVIRCFLTVLTLEGISACTRVLSMLVMCAAKLLEAEVVCSNTKVTTVETGKNARIVGRSFLPRGHCILTGKRHTLCQKSVFFVILRSPATAILRSTCKHTELFTRDKRKSF